MSLWGRRVQSVSQFSCLQSALDYLCPHPQVAVSTLNPTSLMSQAVRAVTQMESVAMSTEWHVDMCPRASHPFRDQPPDPHHQTRLIGI